jgi:two-component system, cell cycle sensor histidine kinase and response regulator CckA
MSPASAAASFRAFADCLREAAILVSTTGDVLALNATAGNLLGVGPLAGTLSFRLADYLHGGGAALDDFIRACSRTRQPIFASLALRSPSGVAQSYRAEGLLYQQADDTSPATVFLRLIPSASANAPMVAIDERLRSFARGHSGAPRHVNVNDLVAAAAGLLRPLLSDGIDLVTRLSPRAPVVYIDPSQVDRVLVNLGVHARDQMGGIGTLTIETDSADSGFAPIVVRDTGPAIAAETLATIFEPFATAHAALPGGALSLASSRATLLELGGHIDVESPAEGGTVFTVRLPLPEDASAQPAGRRAAESVTVLIVDDDDVARELMADSLQSAGFVVLSAGDGLAALEIVRAHTSAIDLLIADVVMPRMNGPRLATALREHQPGMRVLYISGYTDGIDLPLNVPNFHSAFMAKPFTRATLVAKVQALLEA